MLPLRSVIVVIVFRAFPIHTCVLPFDPIWTEALLHRKKATQILAESVLSAKDILDMEKQLQKIP